MSEPLKCDRCGEEVHETEKKLVWCTADNPGDPLCILCPTCATLLKLWLKPHAPQGGKDKD